jgi:hypothetical protein
LPVTAGASLFPEVVNTNSIQQSASLSEPNKKAERVLFRSAVCSLWGERSPHFFRTFI